jgi:hypothetical protein
MSGSATRMLEALARKLSGRGPATKRPRRYIDPSMSVEAFLTALKADGIDYAVLRWFDILPRVEPGEDIDILVSDEDLPRLDAYLTGRKGSGQACDIYTPSGLPGTSFQGIAYFPVERARELLSTAVLRAGLVRVPDPKRHFLSLAYHAVYHKGYASGLPSAGSVAPLKRRKDHDYAASLAGVAREAGFDLDDFSLERLDETLAAELWRPPRDALEKLAAGNAWIRDRFFTEIAALPPHWKGFTVFLVRDEGMRYLDDIKKLIVEEGFDILAESAIEGAARERTVRDTRGGNWGRGPWPMSGGHPAYALAMYDCHPIKPDDELSSQHPGLVNARIMALKLKLRDFANDRRKPAERCNIAHSADNAVQARHYAELALSPGTIERLEPEILRLYGSFVTPYPVIRDLSRDARRAKVEVVEFRGGQAVCKTYRPGREDFLARELLAREVGADFPEMSPILEAGDRYFVTELYVDNIRGLGRLRPLYQDHSFLPPRVIRRVRAFYWAFRERGYELAGLRPANFVWDERRGLRVLGFESIAQRDESGRDCGLSRAEYYEHWFPWTGIPFRLFEIGAPALACFAAQAGSVLRLSAYRLARHFLGEVKRLIRSALKRLLA